MSVKVYKTNAIIISSLESMQGLVDWAKGPQASGLTGKRVIVVEDNIWTTIKPSKRVGTVVSLFCKLISQSSARNLEFLFITNHPEYMDPRIRKYIEEIRLEF